MSDPPQEGTPTLAAALRAAAAAGLPAAACCTALLFAAGGPGRTPLASAAAALLLYTALFGLGADRGAAAVGSWIAAGSPLRALLLPAAALATALACGLAAGGRPGGGLLTAAALLLLPSLLLALRRGAPIGALEVVALALAGAPLPGLKAGLDTGMPAGDGSVDAALRLASLVALLHAAAAARGIAGVGLSRRPRLRPLAATAGTWLGFFLLCLAVATAAGAVRYTGHPPPTWAGAHRALLKLARIALHVALFEELLFRGLLQRTVALALAAPGRPEAAWRRGLALLLPLSAAAGLALRGPAWAPPLACLALFLACRRTAARDPAGAAAVALVGTAFGLVHFHAGSALFVALAIVAGGVYGELYRRYQALAYPILIHTLINASPLIFGLGLAK
ncbi:MAG: CPBP family intramembrane metalloprotease [Nitrospirae bacterium]|nr:MAG: CPBP family intramembrane metalloprotease [Nitrospirota bacterium]